MTYKGCEIRKFQNGYVWDEEAYGAESDDVFATVEAAKADIDNYFTNAAENGPTQTYDNADDHPRR